MRVLRAVESKYSVLPTSLAHVEQILDTESTQKAIKGQNISKLENTMQALERENRELLN